MINPIHGGWTEGRQDGVPPSFCFSRQVGSFFLTIVAMNGLDGSLGISGHFVVFPVISF